jgi:hypothetical protein
MFNIIENFNIAHQVAIAIQKQLEVTCAPPAHANISFVTVCSSAVEANEEMAKLALSMPCSLLISNFISDVPGLHRFGLCERTEDTLYMTDVKLYRPQHGKIRLLALEDSRSWTIDDYVLNRADTPSPAQIRKGLKRGQRDFQALLPDNYVCSPYRDGIWQTISVK